MVFLIVMSACRPGNPRFRADATKSGADNRTVNGENRQTITVFAAASLTEAMEDMANQFTQLNSQANFIFNFAGSQQLAQQIIQGAPADLFISADKEKLEAVVEAGRANPDEVTRIAGNQLAIIVSREASEEIQALNDLAKPGLKLVMAAKEVPVGAYTLQFLDKAAEDPELGDEFRKNVMNNIVSYEENVRAVLSKVALGEADAGFVYLSDVGTLNSQQVGSETGQKVLVIDIPPALNILTTYFAAPMSDSQHVNFVRLFIEFIISDQGQGILAQHGLIPVK
jgi:molybdate transport system substrate-binding protein